jgi:hypothetical protein
MPRRAEALAVLRTVRDLKAAGRARRSMRYNPLRLIFWRLAKPYFRALLEDNRALREDLAALRGEIDANRIAILPLSTRLASLEAFVAESQGLNSGEDPAAGQPATTVFPRVMNSAKR